MSKRPSVFMGGSNAKTEAQARINFGLGPANNIVHNQVIANTVGISVSGVLVGDGRYANINFTGSGVSAVLDNNFGNVNVVISGGGAGSIDDGTAADPGFIYTTEADMGFFKPSSNTMGFATAGGLRWRINASALFPGSNIVYDIGTSTSGFVRTVYTENLVANSGVVTRPAITFKDDETTGIFGGGLGVGSISFTTGGTARFHMTSTAILPDTFDVFDLGSGSRFFKTTHTRNVWGNSGSVLNPTYTFANDRDTGIFHPALNHFGITIGGVGAWKFTTDNLAPMANTVMNIGAHPSNYVKTIFTDNLLSNIGTATEPTYSFAGDPDTGMFHPGVDNQINFAAGGTARWGYHASAMYPISNSTINFGSISNMWNTGYIGTLYTEDGSAGSPSITFAGDQDTGFYSSGLGNISISLDGIQTGIWRQGNLVANTVGAGVFDTTLSGRFSNIVFTNAHSVTSTNFGNVTVDVGTVQGKQTIWVPSGAMTPTITDGCAPLVSIETTALRPDMQVLDFDGTSDEHAQFSIAFPKSWNLGTVSFQVFWFAGGAVTTGVAVGLSALAVGDNESVDAAMSTPIVVTDDAQGAVEEMLVSSESAALTITGTPANDDLVFFDVVRDISDGNDDMTQDMRLAGIKIFFTTDSDRDN